MNILTVYGTRPEFIRLSVIISELDSYSDQTLVHTGQNWDPNLSDIFFRDLELRSPDVRMDIQSHDFPDQLGAMMGGLSDAIDSANPDRILILGDTNSSLAASIIAARKMIPTYHLEAGNRCYDPRVPEEINRRIIDHCTTISMPYTYRSKENLIKEGIDRKNIFVTGNPINEVMNKYANKINLSNALSRLSLESKNYILVTAHRSENVDDRIRLVSLLEGLNKARLEYSKPVVISLHPRTKDKMDKWGLTEQYPELQYCAPFGFMDFVNLEKNALCVITDSGTVQEECCILGVPNITIRDTTERPETIECGSNMLVGANPNLMLDGVKAVIETPSQWTPPSEYTENHVSRTVRNIVLGYTD